MWVYNDVLNKDDLKKLQDFVLTGKCPYRFNATNLGETAKDNRPLPGHENQFMFTYSFYKDRTEQKNWHLIKPIYDYVVDKFKDEKYPVLECLRAKANCYTNQHKHIDYGKHRDHDEWGPKELMLGVFSVNTNNGGTMVRGKLYPSIENQLVLLDNVPHYGVTQTDEQIRVIINWNFIRHTTREKFT